MSAEAAHALTLEQVTVLIATGMATTVIALGVVFGGFFAERRLRDRLEDLDRRTRSGPRSLQMATLRRVERPGRLPTLDKLLWRWFPNASSIRQKLQTTGMNITLGDFAFATLALAMGMAFLLYLVLDLPPEESDNYEALMRAAGALLVAALLAKPTALLPAAALARTVKSRLRRPRREPAPIA